MYTKRQKVNIDDTRFIFTTNFSGDPERDRFGSDQRRVNVVIPTEELAQHLLDLGVKLDLVQKSGSWFAMGETRLGQGRDAAKQYLKDNPQVADSLEAAIRRDFFKLMGTQSQIAAKAAGRAVDVSADDFDDAD